ncbi:hypothetical protein BDN72DRAFT_862174 [Pluteus cervinus]|uniref:Uncharacterized protein n=1 Tax=Pluteus cervinus TaxID=181527 RepID=A0ACD3ACT2_9AGAR|nr:hypothetical protein BDN72DRAFT_862174 [Pluteus cervinus]
MPCTRSQSEIHDARLAAQSLPIPSSPSLDRELAGKSPSKKAIEAQIRQELLTIVPKPPKSDHSKTPCAKKEHKLGTQVKLSATDDHLGCWYIYCHNHRRPCFINDPVNPETHPRLAELLRIRRERDRPGASPARTSTSTAVGSPSKSVTSSSSQTHKSGKHAPPLSPPLYGPTFSEVLKPLGPAPQLHVSLWTDDDFIRGIVLPRTGVFSFSISLADMKRELSAVAFKQGTPLEIYSREYGQWLPLPWDAVLYPAALSNALLIKYASVADPAAFEDVLKERIPLDDVDEH